MEMRWSLKELYPSFESAAFKNDLKKLQKDIDTMREWTEKNLCDRKNPSSKIEEYLKIRTAFTARYMRLSVFSQLSFSVNTSDATAKRYIENLDTMVSETARESVTFAKWLASIEKLDAIIRKSKLLREHRFFLEEILEGTRHLLSENEEVLFAKLRTTGSTAWESLHSTLTSTLMVPVKKGKKIVELPLPMVRNLAYDANPEVRKNAYEAEQSAYEKIAEPAAAALNAIKGEVITTTRLRHYDSPLSMTLERSRMDKKTLDAMLKAMEKSLPSFRRYLKHKAKLIGRKGALPFYDMFAPIGKSSMKFTYDEAHQYIVEQFGTFSKELAQYADTAFTKKWIDAEPRKGKVGGAFCANIHAIGESRILANFDGSFNNVVTIAHELGHGYHGHCLTKESLLNSEYPMPLAETASIFCETIVTQAALKKANKKDRLAILESELQSATQVVVDIYSRYLFETALFANRTEASVPVETMKKLMLDAQKKAYGDGLDKNLRHPYMWLNKPHYYSADYNFYNFPYAFGLLFAKGLYAEYKKRGEAFTAQYDALLRETGKNKIADVTAMMDIDVRSLKFWQGSLSIIEKNIDEFCAL